MDPPKGPVVLLDSVIFSRAIAQSRKSPRGRMILPFHKSHDDLLQRMLNVLQPGSYIQPHRHVSPPKAESILVLKGSICFVSFEDAGEIDDYFLLSRGSGKIGIDVMPGVFHTFFALEEDTVLFEVKPGPYAQIDDKDFAAWAPVEGSEGAKEYLEKLWDHFPISCRK
ncbi:MAG: WbuC family cupin fold metalloprotein [Deltaproteobacteria bacterium]|nr:WbuC family cupin fold metalloprotein [Deltaproteobacteria bacterium]